MVIGGEQHKADLWAIKAFEQLKRNNLTPTPENYAIFYYYISETRPELKLAIDAAYETRGTLSQPVCSELYQRYLGLEIERKMLRETNEALDLQLKNVLLVLDSVTEGNDQYSKSLDTFTGNLTQSRSIEQIREAVSKVMSETRTMVKQNEMLHSQLEQTTQQLTEVRSNLDKVHHEAQLDPLTEIGNRKFFDQEIARVLSEARESETSIAMLMIDVDHFKKFNDNYGHQIGDQVLRLVARTLVENLKGRDVIARYGGEEFVILLPHTRLMDAEKVANLLRASLSTKQIKRRSTNETLGNITISIGAAEYDLVEDAETLIGRADRAMYKAKQTGRNRVVCDEIEHLPGKPLPKA